MDKIQAMRAFIRVVDAGTFTAAAQSLDTTTSAVSRAAAELETRLRTRLLNRSTRRLSLTDEGERYLERSRRILADIDEAEEEARAGEHPAGVLEIHSYASIGQHYVLPAVSKYHELYPDVKIELTLSQQMLDLFGGGSDVAVVTASSLPDSDLVSCLLGSTYSVLCASPDYIRVNGAPQEVADLRQHECLKLKAPSWPANEWLLESPQGSESMIVSASVQINIADALVKAIQQGMGIGMLPLCAAVRGLRDGTLARVLPNHTLQRMNIYMCRKT
jgi:DNA-binding transcriptional LysR family regulator